MGASCKCQTKSCFQDVYINDSGSNSHNGKELPVMITTKTKQPLVKYFPFPKPSTTNQDSYYSQDDYNTMLMEVDNKGEADRECSADCTKDGKLSCLECRISKHLDNLRKSCTMVVVPLRSNTLNRINSIYRGCYEFSLYKDTNNKDTSVEAVPPSKEFPTEINRPTQSKVQFQQQEFRSHDGLLSNTCEDNAIPKLSSSIQKYIDLYPPPSYLSPIATQNFAIDHKLVCPTQKLLEMLEEPADPKSTEALLGFTFFQKGAKDVQELKIPAKQKAIEVSLAKDISFEGYFAFFESLFEESLNGFLLIGKFNRSSKELNGCFMMYFEDGVVVAGYGQKGVIRAGSVYYAGENKKSLIANGKKLDEHSPHESTKQDSNLPTKQTTSDNKRLYAVIVPDTANQPLSNQHLPNEETFEQRCNSISIGMMDDNENRERDANQLQMNDPRVITSTRRSLGVIPEVTEPSATEIHRFNYAGSPTNDHGSSSLFQQLHSRKLKESNIGGAKGVANNPSGPLLTESSIKPSEMCRPTQSLIEQNLPQDERPDYNTKSMQNDRFEFSLNDSPLLNSQQKQPVSKSKTHGSKFALTRLS